MNSPGNAKKGSESSNDSEKNKKDASGGYRELLESFIVALVLAFFFKSFVAEVFVIPTGSMAPTLLGAHKDIRCPDCGMRYHAGASLETDQNSGGRTDYIVIGGICPLCRSQNNLDLRTTGDKTAMGDRIVVGKFNYLFSDPKRWDVIVFKYPQDARINYIKRLIGCPNEQILIQHGDIYTKPLDPREGTPLSEGGTPSSEGTEQTFTIARKPVDKVETLQQDVFDSANVPGSLVKAGWPSNWQSWPVQSSAKWDVTFTEKAWRATVDATNTSLSDTSLLRYFHRFPSLEEWRKVHDGQGNFKDVAPHTGTLITDFASYNAMIVAPHAAVYKKDGSIYPNYKGGLYPDQALARSSEYSIGHGGSRSIESEDGNHWVGDLLAEFEIDLDASNEGTLILELVEKGIRLQCQILTSSGEASWQILYENAPIDIWEQVPASQSPKAQTSVRSQGKYRIKIANVDNQLFLWVNGRLVQFDFPTTYDDSRKLSVEQQRPHWTPNDPLDAAPIAIGLAKGKMTVERTKVWRDVYYIAHSMGGHLTDYPLDTDLIESVVDPETRRIIEQAARSELNSEQLLLAVIKTVYSSPTTWDKTNLFRMRRVRSYTLEDKQFFPMGDNSAASADARSWYTHYVNRELLIGKALVLLWPHSPYMFVPQFGRLGLIR